MIETALISKVIPTRIVSSLRFQNEILYIIMSRTQYILNVIQPIVKTEALHCVEILLVLYKWLKFLKFISFDQSENAFNKQLPRLIKTDGYYSLDRFWIINFVIYTYKVFYPFPICPWGNSFRTLIPPSMPDILSERVYPYACFTLPISFFRITFYHFYVLVFNCVSI